jgi:hypothetical protein
VRFWELRTLRSNPKFPWSLRNNFFPCFAGAPLASRPNLIFAPQLPCPLSTTLRDLRPRTKQAIVPDTCRYRVISAHCLSPTHALHFAHANLICCRASSRAGILHAESPCSAATDNRCGFPVCPPQVGPRHHVGILRVLPPVAYLGPVWLGSPDSAARPLGLVVSACCTRTTVSVANIASINRCQLGHPPRRVRCLHSPA